VLGALLGAFGCGSDAPTSPDSDAGTMGLAVEPPRIAWLDAGEPPIARPALTCAAGWRAVSPMEGVTACDPWPETGRATCTASDEAHFPGEPGCTRVGPACPAGDWAEDLPTDRPTVFVKAGAPAGGDGTQARPFATLAAARTGAAVGTVIAVAKGRYDESVSLGTGMSLWGACVGETVLTSSSPAVDAAVVSASGVGAEVRNLRIDHPSRLGVLAAGATRSLRIQSILIEGAVYAGIGADAAQLDATDLVVRGTRPNGADGGFGVALIDGATATIGRASIDDNSLIAMLVDGTATSLTLTEAAVVRTRSVAGQADAVVAQSGATIDATRVVVEDNVGAGFSTTISGGNLRLADVVVRRNGLPGIEVIPGTLEASSVWCDQAGGVGVLVRNDSTAALTDVIVTATSAPSCAGGYGVAVDGGADLVASRVAVGESQSVGIVVDGEGTSATATDVVVTDTQSACGRGEGVQIAAGAHASFARTLVARGEGVGVVARSGGAQLDLRDVAVRDTAAGAGGERGWGILVGDGGRLSAAGVLVDGAHEVGVVVSDIDTTADLADVLVRNVAGSALTGERGRGWQTQDGARATARRVAIAHVREFGIVVNSGGVVALDEALVSNVLAAECATTTCGGAPGGSGVVVDAAGSIAIVSRFRILDLALCGVQLADGGSLDLSEGEVARAAIGACVGVDGYDVARLTRDVVYHDNGLNLQATTLPLPDTLDALVP